MIALGLRLVPWIVVGGLWGMVVGEDLGVRMGWACLVLAALAWQRFRLDD